MIKAKKQKQYKPKPPIKGVMECEHKHVWSVTDLNPENITRPCPLCGALTDIQKGIQNE